MVLVAYSDSEGSDAEEERKPVTRPISKSTPASNFAVDKSNPKKIRVNLDESIPAPQDRIDGEPAPKRARTGGGAFTGFNAMLPAPKRENEKPVNGNASQPPARKVFSLKTGAEPAFSRDSDSELKELFARQDNETDDMADTIPSTIPKPAFISELSEPSTSQSKAFMFKPLSVSRHTKKKKSAGPIVPPKDITSSQGVSAATTLRQAQTKDPPDAQLPKKQTMNLFSSGQTSLPDDVDDPTPQEDEDEMIEVLDETDLDPSNTSSAPQTAAPDSLTSLADTLHLSAAERRQLFGRNNDPANAKIINFNTDSEYASNQAHIAAGEQIQHNPVRGIAPGKHSLKQLVASAQGQKDALEESFAVGRRNKREVGGRYGW